MRILFMGTPEFAAEVLDEINNGKNEIVGALTQPDKPRGRGYELSMSAVKKYALEKGIDVYQPETLKDNAFLDTLTELDPELIVVAAYGKILPGYVLDYPKHGCINVHGSILPKYRGAAPIQRAIIDGEKLAGITIMKMEAGLDTGDMMLTETCPIEENDNFENVYDKLVVCSRRGITRAIDIIEAGEAVYTKQNDSLATYAEKITKDDCLISFDTTAESLHNRIRGLSPFPLAFTYLDSKLLKITASVIVKRDGDNPDELIGRVVDTDVKSSLITVACKTGLIGFTAVLPEGKKRMSAGDFLRGKAIENGTLLG